jgi:hypothetical protein
MSVTQSHLSHEIHIRRGIEREDDEDRTWPERRGQGKVPISLRGMHGMSYPIPPSSITRPETLGAPHSLHPDLVR